MASEAESVPPSAQDDSGRRMAKAKATAKAAATESESRFFDCDARLRREGTPKPRVSPLSMTTRAMEGLPEEFEDFFVAFERRNQVCARDAVAARGARPIQHFSRE